MAEPSEVQIARLEERLAVILNELQQVQDGRKQQYEKLEEMGRSLLQLSNRVESVEKSLAKASPTIEEFITIKHRVVGAGMLGKWVWAVAGGLIGMLFYARVQIMDFLK